jgi:hypothetical protein
VFADQSCVAQVRGRFLLAVIAVAAIAAVAVLAQIVVPMIHSEEQARADAQAAADVAAYNARMKVVADKVVRPGSLPRDCPEWTDKSQGYFCWMGDADPVEAAITLRDSLAKIASAAPSVRCSKASQYRSCQVRAEIDGLFLNALALPPQVGERGVRLDGSVLERQVWDLPLSGTPLALPH